MAKVKVKLNEKYWDDYVPLELIFGIKAGDDLTPGNTATVYTMNDFDVCQYTDGKNKGKYTFGIETVYIFDSDTKDKHDSNHTDICAYLMNIYEKFKEFCIVQGVDVYGDKSNIDYHFLSYKETFFGPFDTLQDTFNAVKFIILGYVSQFRSTPIDD